MENRNNTWILTDYMNLYCNSFGGEKNVPKKLTKAINLRIFVMVFVSLLMFWRIDLPSLSANIWETLAHETLTTWPTSARYQQRIPSHKVGQPVKTSQNIILVYTTVLKNYTLKKDDHRSNKTELRLLYNYSFLLLLNAFV